MYTDFSEVKKTAINVTDKKRRSSGTLKHSKDFLATTLYVVNSDAVFSFSHKEKDISKINKEVVG